MLWILTPPRNSFICVKPIPVVIVAVTLASFISLYSGSSTGSDQNQALEDKFGTQSLFFDLFGLECPIYKLSLIHLCMIIKSSVFFYLLRMWNQKLSEYVPFLVLQRGHHQLQVLPCYPLLHIFPVFDIIFFRFIFTITLSLDGVSFEYPT